MHSHISKTVAVVLAFTGALFLLFVIQRSTTLLDDIARLQVDVTNPVASANVDPDLRREIDRYLGGGGFKKVSGGSGGGLLSFWSELNDGDGPLGGGDIFRKTESLLPSLDPPDLPWPDPNPFAIKCWTIDSLYSNALSSLGAPPTLSTFSSLNQSFAAQIGSGTLMPGAVGGAFGLVYVCDVHGTPMNFGVGYGPPPGVGGSAAPNAVMFEISFTR